MANKITLTFDDKLRLLPDGIAFEGLGYVAAGLFARNGVPALMMAAQVAGMEYKQHMQGVKLANAPIYEKIANVKDEIETLRLVKASDIASLSDLSATTCADIMHDSSLADKDKKAKVKTEKTRLANKLKGLETTFTKACVPLNDKITKLEATLKK